MGAQSARLRLARRVVIIIVEPRLADRHHLRVLSHPGQLLRCDVELLVGTVRMRSDRAKDLVIALGDPLHLSEAADARADRHHLVHARRMRPRDNPLEVVGEIGKVEVTMMIDEHQASAIARRGNTGAGCGISVPALRRPVPPNAAKLRCSASCPSWSSSFPAEPGMTGAARIATCRTTSAVT